LGNTNLRGYLNNWNHRRKIRFQNYWCYRKIPENAMEMILNGGKKNSRLTLKI
jgi:hypothetical protein